MAETVLGDADGTDDFGQLMWIVVRSIGLIFLKHSYLLWNIVALVGLLVAWKYLSRPAVAPVVKTKGSKKKRSERPSSDDDEPDQPVHHSRGRSPRHGDRD
jgi:hypothetical protein